MWAPIPKNPPKRSEKYRRFVATLNCAHCRAWGPSQCAHSDTGKGLAMKASDETCYPLCPPCHVLIGSTGKLGKETRRDLEIVYGEMTRLHAQNLGVWPWK